MKNIQKISKITAVVFIIAGLILIFGKQEWFPDFYRPQFMGVMAFISAFLIVLPNLIFKFPDDPLKQKTLIFFQNVLIITLLLNGLGELGFYQLYKIGFEYDKLLHFIVPFISVMALSSFGFNWYGWSFRKSIILSVVLVIIGGFLWEFFEFFGDRFFKTEMFGYYGKFIIKDTVWDLIMNFFGIVGGIIASNFIKNKC
ncbi:MAG: hypothetical protein Q8N28_02360 [bacterium]|nr:hypothetical protein [bacterium]